MEMSDERIGWYQIRRVWLHDGSCKRWAVHVADCPYKPVAFAWTRLGARWVRYRRNRWLDGLLRGIQGLD